MKTRNVRMRQWYRHHRRYRHLTSRSDGYEQRLVCDWIRKLKRRNHRMGLWTCAVCLMTFGHKTKSKPPVCDSCLRMPRWMWPDDCKGVQT